ncbi:helix-turn-helix transcriptional regulator [Streptomyces sp. H27-D2]|uniref:helix-turn-helix transcriptional regulator n=1 Tax=Streptomyces sp. H27-D2 TaxID=3046304 RepID=UPI002DBF8024|nr:LuxR C-terminal-related transcriptional regulator [Streptomyces sp. H27-D2]MEC4017523.1 LuxR C-terminal-related transcriptional regulator [Streptomyces sp. H27-D2]
MEAHGWSAPEDVLASAITVLRAPLPQILPRLSDAIADLAPHRAVAELTGNCAHSPMKASGEPGVAEKITSAELGRLEGLIPVGRPWQGEAVLAGATRPVLAVASAPEGSSGALLVVVRSDAGPLSEQVLTVLQRLWDLVTVHSGRRMAEATPGQAATSRAAAGARARVIAELTDAHTSALSAILGTLRANSLDDEAARRGAMDLAVAAMIELRAGADLDRELSEEPADKAFARLADELKPLLRHSSVRLDLRAPDAQRTVPADTAHAARAAVRASVLAMLEQDEVHRVHVGWQLDRDDLRVSVRDDGPGALQREALAVHRITERLTALDGSLDLDAVPGWGTTITVTLPLGAAAGIAANPVADLHPREYEVLGELARGRRNRDIAQSLHITESTVKFHVANIFGKLGVSSRGEATAVAHRAGLTG